MFIDEYIAKNMIKGKYLKYDYPLYFTPELKPFVNEKWFKNERIQIKIKENLPENFSELRKAGENESLNLSNDPKRFSN